MARLQPVVEPDAPRALLLGAQLGERDHVAESQTGIGGSGDGCIVLDPVTGAVVDGNPADSEYGTFNVGGSTVTLNYCSKGDLNCSSRARTANEAGGADAGAPQLCVLPASAVTGGHRRWVHRVPHPSHATP